MAVGAEIIVVQSVGVGERLVKELVEQFRMRPYKGKAIKHGVSKVTEVRIRTNGAFV